MCNSNNCKLMRNSNNYKLMRYSNNNKLMCNSNNNKLMCNSNNKCVSLTSFRAPYVTGASGLKCMGSCWVASASASKRAVPANTFETIY